MTLPAVKHDRRLYVVIAVASVLLPYLQNYSAKPSLPDQTSDSEIIMLTADDPRVLEAKNQAQQNLNSFIEQVKAQKVTHSYSVKTVIGESEHIWVEVASYNDDTKQFHGTLANEPITEGYKIDDEINVDASTVEDWTIRDSQWEIVEGGYSIKLLEDEIKKKQTQ